MNHLTRDQIEAFRRIKNFILSSKGRCFILSGYAGTGKTFLLKLIADWLVNEAKLSFALLAPTGRAARILSELTGYEANTIHSFIYDLNNLMEYEKKETKEYYINFYFGVKSGQQDNTPSILLIDEASLIPDISGENDVIKFGSSSLLKDLFVYAKIFIPHTKTKIIFAGDPAQLPPVNMDISPALSPQYLEKNYGVKVENFTLKEIIRQKSNSHLLKTATRIRENIENQKLDELNIEADNKEIVEIAFSDISAIAKRYYMPYIKEGKANPDLICITHSNKTANNLNKMIRSALFGSSQGNLPIRQGDWLLVVSNNRRFNLNNGDLVWVSYADPKTEERLVTINYQKQEKQVKLIFRNLNVVFFKTNSTAIEINCKLLENTLYTQSSDISSEEFVALYFDFKNRHKGITHKHPDFYRIMMDDIYLNSLRAKFGYAVTCHKAQGGEWKNVIIAFERQQPSIDTLKWTYTALARAKEKVYGIHLPKVKSWSNTSNTNLQTNSPNILVKNDNIIAIAKNEEDARLDDTTTTPQEEVKFLEKFTDAPTFLKDKHLHFAKALQKLSANILDVDVVLNNYYVRYLITHPNNPNAIIKFHVMFDKNGNFTPKILSQAPETEIEQKIKEAFLFSQRYEEKEDSISYENPMLQNFFKELIEPNCTAQNIRIIKVEHLQYRERYHFLYNNSESIIDFIYNKKGIIKNIEVVVGNDIRNLLISPRN